MEPLAALPAVRNDELDWDRFNPGSYRAHNYRILRDDDRQIVTRVRNFMADSGVGPHARGVDIGPGANLYPSLAMLPFCDRLDLIEISAANVRWLRRQGRWWHRFDRRWNPFWAVYTENAVYKDYAAGRKPMVEFGRKAVISQGSVFRLPRAEWDMGTMFFVACSLSTDLNEFHDAVHGFVGSLKPKAPFAAAFMTKSNGYYVAGQWFPAVPIDDVTVKRSLNDVAYDVRIDPIDSSDPLRPDVGMLLATGRAQGT
jgi:hypothetical protein